MSANCLSANCLSANRTIPGQVRVGYVVCGTKYPARGDESKKISLFGGWALPSVVGQKWSVSGRRWSDAILNVFLIIFK